MLTDKPVIVETNTPLFNRDISWLYFNERILDEAAKNDVPLLEKLNFLAIFSSNLDEFYRVRMPVLSALKKIKKNTKTDFTEIEGSNYKKAKAIINKQQEKYGSILRTIILPQFKEQGVNVIYNTPIPSEIEKITEDYFFSKIAAFLEIESFNALFFPKNNNLYFLIAFENAEEDLTIVNIPSDKISRFFKTTENNHQYVVFIDDIIKQHLPFLFPNQIIKDCYSFKITRDAELDLENEFEGDLAEKIAQQIAKRDFGLATRLLYPASLPLNLLNKLKETLNLPKSSLFGGGNYHNLKDFFKFPIANDALKYPKYPALNYTFKTKSPSVFQEIKHNDILISTPYQDYSTILRFFNEAAIDPLVEEIYTSMYRVANDSLILHALISAVKNGKKATVFVELKARFDEENNLKWAKKLKEAGVKVIYSIPNLKVHAKVALIKRKTTNDYEYFGLLSTGNLNENTAKIYSDYVLLTANKDLLIELENVFTYIIEKRNITAAGSINFKHLLVAQFNLVDEFLTLINEEIKQAKLGFHASIIIKLNNLEEKKMIEKLYEASQAGVKIQLIVRSICKLIPGINGLSENISIKRIVGRYLEHSRVFIFHNKGNEKVFLGSADWMNRNIHNRIEVCFPIYNETIKKQIKKMIAIQLNDDASAVMLNSELQNIVIKNVNNIRSQDEIYTYLKNITN